MDRRHTAKGVWVGAAVAAPALLLAACGGSSGTSSSGTSTSDHARVTTHANGQVSYLTDSTGRSLYLFESDHGSESSCGSGCDTVWPPLTTDGQPHTAPGTHAGMLGTISRSDGSTQVTYGGHPLYYYSGDSQPHQTNGEGLDDFGAEWYLVSPGGTNVEHLGGSSSGDSDDASSGDSNTSSSAETGGGW